MLAPAHALFEPEQRHLCFFELAGGGALEVEDRDRHLETLRPARVRQREADALGTFADTVAHPPATNSDRTDAGHDLTLRQVAVAHQTSATIVDYLVGVSLEQSRYLGFAACPSSLARHCATPRSADQQKFLAGQLQNLSVGMAYRSRVEASNLRYATTSLHAITNF